MIKKSEKGFSLIELIIVVGLSAMIALMAATFIFHALRTTQQNNEHLTRLANVENAGYWISRDASMADSVSANLTPPSLLFLTWTDWGYETDNVYHSITYSIENISGGVGQLKRRHQDSNGTDQQTLIANYIDPTTTNVTYHTPTLTLRVAARSSGTSEVMVYEVYPRPNY